MNILIKVLEFVSRHVLLFMILSGVLIGLAVDSIADAIFVILGMTILMVTIVVDIYQEFENRDDCSSSKT